MRRRKGVLNSITHVLLAPKNRVNLPAFWLPTCSIPSKLAAPEAFMRVLGLTPIESTTKAKGSNRHQRNSKENTGRFMTKLSIIIPLDWDVV